MHTHTHLIQQPSFVPIYIYLYMYIVHLLLTWLKYEHKLSHCQLPFGAFIVTNALLTTSVCKIPKSQHSKGVHACNVINWRVKYNSIFGTREPEEFWYIWRPGRIADREGGGLSPRCVCLVLCGFLHHLRTILSHYVVIWRRRVFIVIACSFLGWLALCECVCVCFGVTELGRPSRDWLSQY